MEEKRNNDRPEFKETLDNMDSLKVIYQNIQGTFSMTVCYSIKIVKFFWKYHCSIFIFKRGPGNSELFIKKRYSISKL